MPLPAWIAIGGGSGLLVGILACYIWFRKIHTKGLLKQEDLVSEGNKKADEVLNQAQNEAGRTKNEAQKEAREERNQLKQFESRLQKKEDLIERRMDSVQGKERHLENKSKEMEKRDRTTQQKEGEVTKILDEEKESLHRISGLTKEEAVKTLLDKLEPELEKEKADLIRKRLEVAKDTAETEAKRVITMAIQRFAAEHTADSVVTVVDLPNEEMKGRIIGREGRNIRAFERSTGVDVIVDDAGHLECSRGRLRETKAGQVRSLRDRARRIGVTDSHS